MLSKLFKKTDVKKNLVISVIGTGLGQLIHLALTPIISRIYSPELFGQYSLFLSLLGVFTTMTLCKLDLAIIVSDDDEVPQLRRILFKMMSITTCLALSIYIFLWLDDSAHKTIFLFLVLTIPISGKFWMHRSIINKAKLFRRLSYGKVLENSLNGVITILLGTLSFKEIGLFTGKLTALFFTWLYFRVKSSKLFLDKSALTTKEVLRKYINYPKYSFPGELIAHLNLSSTIFLFAYLFSPLEVGLIGLTTRVMSVPANFISISFFDVFKEKAVSDFKEFGSFSTIFQKFLILLLSIAIGMIFVAYFTSPFLFPFIFGEEWGKAGLYAQYLCIFYAIRLVTGPLIFSFEITGKHYVNLIFQSVYLIVGITSIALTYYYTQNDLQCIKVYSLSLAIIYSFHIILAYINSRKRVV
jgi:O-antigen/teichoic acid export membrane protein